MSGAFKFRGIFLCSIWPTIKVNDIDFTKYKEAKGLFIEDPWERVKSIFSRDPMGAFHPELEYIIQNATLGLFVGGMYGGTLESTKTTDDFIRTNDGNIYSNKREMYKILANENMRGLVKGIFKYAPKCGLFCGGFTLICSCCEAYRNSSKVIDCTLAGFSMGALSKCGFGLRGLLSGGIFGGLFGACFGIMKWIRYKLTKVDDLEIKYAHFAYVRQRELLMKGVKETPADALRSSTLDDFEFEESEPEAEEQN